MRTSHFVEPAIRSSLPGIEILLLRSHVSLESIRREKQLLIDFLSASAGGPMLYTGRDMETSHRGMRISKSDWMVFIGHLNDTLNHFELADAEKNDVLGFIESTKSEIVEA